MEFNWSEQEEPHKSRRLQILGIVHNNLLRIFLHTFTFQIDLC